MDCPTCGSAAGFECHQGAGVCPDTGDFDGEYLACVDCGAETDAAELERLELVERKPPATAVPTIEWRETA